MRDRFRGIRGLALVVVVWLVATLVVPERLMPGPFETARRMLSLFAEAGLALHLGASLLRIVVALAISVLLGVPLGILMGMSRRFDQLFGPAAYVLYPVPKIALLPVLMLFLGLGNASKVTLVVVIVVFQLIFAARDGVRELPASVFISARSLHLRGAALYRHAVIPAVLPRLWSSVRLSLGISFSVIFFAESFATRYGVGFFIVNAWAQVNYADLYAGILALSLVGFLMFRFVDAAERLTCPWLRRE